MRQVDNMWITLQGVNNSCCYVCLRDSPLNVTLIQTVNIQFQIGGCQHIFSFLMTEKG